MAGSHSIRRRLGPAERLRVLSAVLAVLVAGCASTRVTQTKRSGTEQELLVQSLERALAHLDLSRFTGKRVALKLYALTPDQGFATEFVTSRIEAKGVEVVPDAAKADLRLKIFARVLAVDQGQTLVGIPALVVPVLGYPIPEIALFKWVRNRGRSEVEIFTYDPHTDRFIDATPVGIGRTKYDEFTVLLFIGFTVDDLTEPPEPSGQ
jgi:hypothetical protein